MGEIILLLKIKIMLNKIFFPLVILLFVACVDSTKSKLGALEDAKWTAVMANHDVVMPMMGTTSKVRKQLKQLKADYTEMSPEDTEKIDQLISKLEKADEGMMDWMNGLQQLKKLQATKEHKEIISYLDQQDELIKQVGKDMTNSIQEGLKFVELMKANK